MSRSILIDGILELHNSILKTSSVWSNMNRNSKPYSTWRVDIVGQQDKRPRAGNGLQPPREDLTSAEPHTVLHITLLWTKTAQFFTFWWTALNAMYFVLWLSLPCAEHNSTNSPKGTAHWLLLHLVSVGKHTWSTEPAPTLHCPCFTHIYSYLLPSCLNLSIKFHHHGHQKSLSFFYHTFDICIVYTDISDNFVMLVSSSPS